MDSELEELGSGVIWFVGIILAALLSLGGAVIVGWQ